MYFGKSIRYEMDGAGDIVGISIPFAAGVAAGAVTENLLGTSAMYAGASAACFCAVALLAVLCLTHRHTPFCQLLLFFTGALCFCTSSLSGPKEAAGWIPAQKTLAAFLRFIDCAGFGQDTAGLVKALLTGDRSGISGSTVEDFRLSGASHILALSGLHLGIIYGLLVKLLSPLGNSRAAAVVKAAIKTSTCGFYTLMTGAGPSIVRAFLFIVINEFLRLQPGRRRRPAAILCTALTIQLAFSPRVVLSVGFQLSYLAMTGIVTVFPRIDAWYPESWKWDPLRKLWSSAALAISCQLFTAPVVWLRFHTFPMYFIVTNLVSLPLTEALILTASGSLALEALGICPQIIKSLSDEIAQALIFCLEVVSSM